MLVRRLSNAIDGWYTRRRTIRILSALDDRHLRDIGVDRMKDMDITWEDVYREIHKTFRRL